LDREVLIAHLHQISVSNGGVPKLAVPEGRITTQGVIGDRQRSPDIHGGPDRAVCLFSLEAIQALQREGHSIAPGSSGENLTLAGLDWKQLKPGDRLKIGEHVRLEIMSYTSPCQHNAQWFQNGDFKRISQKRHPGWSRLYARVLSEGTVRPGDPVQVEKVEVKVEVKQSRP
jgi:MOSC domain-containing protein YiiM